MAFEAPPPTPSESSTIDTISKGAAKPADRRHDLDDVFTQSVEDLLQSLQLYPDKTETFPPTEALTEEFQKLSSVMQKFYSGADTGYQPLDQYRKGHVTSEGTYPGKVSLENGKSVDAHVIDLGDSTTGDHYLGSSFPGGSFSVEEYFQLLWERGATAAVALKEAKWYPLGNVGDTFTHGDISVRILAIPQLPPDHPAGGLVSLAQCELQRGGERRPFTAMSVKWPNGGTLEPPVLASAVRLLDANHEPGRIAVHCGAGIGRAGTFIAAHSLVGWALREGSSADLYGQGVKTLLRLRCQRGDTAHEMVETVPQFASVLEAAKAVVADK